MYYKKLVLAICSLLSMLFVNAQDLENSFGVKGGLNLTFFNVDLQNQGSYSTSEVGFYGGVFVEFPIDQSFGVQIETLYISVGDFDFLNVPLYAKYEVANRLHLMAGPSVSYFFDFFTSKLKIGADISSTYDISPSLDAHIKFALGIDELAPHGLFFGLGLKL